MAKIQVRSQQNVTTGRQRDSKQHSHVALQGRLERSYDVMQMVRAKVVIRRWMQRMIRRTRDAEQAKKLFEYYKSL